MFSKIYILFIILICFSVSAFGNDDFNDLKKEKNALIFHSTTIDFELVNGLIVLKAQVEGVYGDFILDTGASSILINQKVYKGSISLGTIGEELEAESLSAREISIGSVVHIVADILAVDLSNVESIIKRPIAGIIGSHILTKYNVVVDYEQSEVVLINPDRKSLDFNSEDYSVTSLPLTLANDNLMIVSINVDDEEKRYIFDTGAATNVSFENSEIAQNSSKQISFNGIRIENAPFVYKSDENLNPQLNNLYEGILSPYTLTADKVLIDFMSSKVYLFFKNEKSS